MEIRPYRTDDLNDLYAIALATGYAGEDASSLFRDASLIGHIYAAPYASLKPELTWVAVDEQGVCGYIVGVEDTESWEDQLEDLWWPDLRSVYLDPDEQALSRWTHDESYIKMMFTPERTPPVVSQSYPAHVHLNLHARAQRKGVGSRLLQRWLSAAAVRGFAGVHIAVNQQNGAGMQFWRKQGFREIDVAGVQGGTVWMGLAVTEAGTHSDDDL
jgi:GNAT superfamily N-acetyltransferase